MCTPESLVFSVFTLMQKHSLAKMIFFPEGLGGTDDIILVEILECGWGYSFVQKTEIPGRWGVFQTIPSVEEVWILFGTTLWGEGTVLLKWFSLQVPPKLFTMSNVLKCISMLNVWKSLMFFRILVHIHVSCKTTSAQLAATFVHVT